MLEPGVWVKKKLYPRRCDLSPDGRLLLFMLMGNFGYRNECFSGISSVPWLHPHAQLRNLGTHTRGWCFYEPGVPHVWSFGVDKWVGAERFVIARNDAVQFVNELRRGWTYAADCPAREPHDTWDEKRRIILEKASGTHTLRMTDHCYDPNPPAVDGRAPSYELRCGSNAEALTEACWADFDHHGRLLLATKGGSLRMERLGSSSQRELIVEHDLRDMKPTPEPPPAWATVLPEGL
jgi:hypothetical protein